jgi:uncharacterized protein YdaU (DUF1376 family)
MSLPYYKRFPRDFLEGTIGLSFEVKGAYAIVLDLIYMRDGRLPDDARFIAGQLGCSVRKWTAIREELIARGKLQVHEGMISNFRADYLTEESRKYQDKQAEIAGKPRKNNALPQPQPSQSESEPEEEEPPTPKGEKRRKPRTAIPADFPDAEAIAEGQAKARSVGANVDAAAQAERFRNHAAQNDRRCADWRAAWRNWMAGAVEKAPKTAIAALTARTAPPSPADRWDGVVREFRANGYWNRDDNGPPPGREGCRAPPSILALYGYATAAKHANDPQPQEAAA